jgi:hypothetical protein
MEPRVFRPGVHGSMNIKTTLLGMALLAVLAAGAWWARSPSPTAATAPAALGEISGNDDLPDLTLAAATADAGGVRITLSLSPNPPVAFATTRVRVRAEAGGSPVLLDGGRIRFEMAMPMGDHRYSLVAGEGGWQEADVVLPLCGSGQRRWYATVEGTVGGQPRTARFRLDLAPPPSAPAP